MSYLTISALGLAGVLNVIQFFENKKQRTQIDMLTHCVAKMLSDRVLEFMKANAPEAK